MFLRVLDDADALAAAAAAEITGLMTGLGRFDLGLAGGATPAGTYRELARAAFDWSRVDAWMTDERYVPRDHPECNAAMVREILSESGKVLAVLQGHEHENDERLLDGVHYVTFAAMVEGEGSGGSAYAIVEIAADGAMHIRGYRMQASYRFGPPRRVRCRA